MSYELLLAAEEGKDLSAADLLCLLSIGGEEEKALLESADRVRSKWVGDTVHLRGIVEFSNFCIQNCLYCGLRRGNRALTRYRMGLSDILAAAEKVRERGYGTVVLQSGEDPWFTQDRVADLVRNIKRKTRLSITLSLGERSYEDYETWKEAGADRYLLKHETASPDLYRHLRPGRELGERLRCLKWLKELGYEVGSGNMVGLPGQTDQDLVQDIQLFKELDFDMIGISPFIPHPRTPLAAESKGDLGKVLRILALTRLVTRDTNLPATTASGVIEKGGRLKALRSGANVVMPDLTPPKHKRHYHIYPGKTSISEGDQEIREAILSIGRSVGQGSGSRVRR